MRRRRDASRRTGAARYHRGWRCRAVSLLAEPIMLAEPQRVVAELPLAGGAPSAIPGLVWAFRLHHDGSAEPLAVDKPFEFSHDGRLWLHFNLTDARARAWLT